MEDRRASLSTLEVLFLASVAAEAVIGRVVTRGLEKTPTLVRGDAQPVVPTTWFVALDYLALFLLYFAAMMGVIVLAVRVVGLIRDWADGSFGDRVHGAVGAATTGMLALSAVAAATLDLEPAQVLLHASLAAVAAHQVVRAWFRRADLGATLGITLAAAPILLYCAASLFSDHLWSDDQLAGGEAQAGLGRWGHILLVLAATLSPYALAPRPFALAITRVVPFAMALAVAGSLSVLIRLRYAAAIAASNRALGIGLPAHANPDQIALYVLALGTVTWTVAACLIAPTPARRRIGLGLGLLVLAGWGFAWPLSFVAAGAGIVLMGDGAIAVRREERAAYQPVTPPIDDETWQSYIGHVVGALRRITGDPLAASAVSVRGEGDHTSTVIVSERHRVPVKVRMSELPALWWRSM